MKTSSTRKLAIAGAVIATLSVASYWYWSPLLALRAMRSAIDSGDAATFNAHVDYPKVRESLKIQAATLIDRQAGQNGQGQDSASLIGGMIKQKIVSGMVDAFVQPDTLMRAMRDGRARSGMPGEEQAGNPPARDKVSWSYKRDGVNQLVVNGMREGQPEEKESLRLVMQRSGFATWKLTEIRLPE